jgi:ribosomal protein L29
MAIKRIIKPTKKAVEVKTLDMLITELATLRNDLINAKRGHKLGELTNPRIITATRKNIARTLTAITAMKIASFAEQRKEIK